MEINILFNIKKLKKGFDVFLSALNKIITTKIKHWCAIENITGLNLHLLFFFQHCLPWICEILTKIIWIDLWIWKKKKQFKFSLNFANIFELGTWLMTSRRFSLKTQDKHLSKEKDEEMQFQVNVILTNDPFLKSTNKSWAQS